MYTGPNIVTDGLVLALDAANTKSYISGSATWNDLSGNGNTGSMVGVPGYDSSNLGGLYFNNAVSNTGVNCGDPSSLSFPQNSFSLAVWFKYAVSGFLINKVGNLGGFNFWYTGTSLRFQIYSGSVAPSPINLVAGTLTNNTYYQVSATYNGSVANTYINGSLVGTQTNSVTVSTTSGNFTIGHRNDAFNTNYSSGSIYNVQVYNRALSASEVLQNYNGQKARFGLN
jgi:hypothetical protein